MSSSESGIGTEGRVGPADDRPLNTQEYELLQRLLSDPFSLPIQFKAWLVAYLETSDLTLPMAAINGLTSTLGIAGAGTGTLGIFPAGLILPFGSDTAPTGSLLCDGASYSQTLQKRLFDVIGTRYGGGAGSFNVPDLRDRVPVGKGVHSDHDTLGKSDGSAPGTRRVKHKHTTVGFNNQTVDAGSAVPVTLGDVQTLSDNRIIHDHAPADGLPAPTDGPAFVTINFVIIN